MDRYHELHQLGKGSYGTCILVKERQRGTTYCMKKINLKGLAPRERQAAFLEVKLLRELRHPFIVRYYDRIIDKVWRGAARRAAAPGAFYPNPTLRGRARRRQRSCTS